MKLQEKNVKNIYFVKHELVLGFSDLWSNQYLDNKLLPMIKQRIFDNAQQDIRGKISISTKCFTYQYLIDNFTLQYCLVMCLPTRYRKCITNILII